MGKQINYYMGCRDFLAIAEAALESGCVIYQHTKESGVWRLIGGTDLSVVKEDCRDYLFHLPSAGALEIEEREGHQHISFDSELSVIEAGFSFVNPEQHIIRSNRLYVITGRYVDGTWVARPEQLTKVYNRLVRIVKKCAPYQEVSHFVVNELYAGTKFTTKEYISPDFLTLAQEQDYKLG